MGKCEKRAWPLTLGLLVNAVALAVHGLIENLPEGLFILMELAAIVLILWGIVETRRRAGLGSVKKPADRNELRLSLE